MKNTPNKMHIIIPKKWDNSLASPKTKEDILKELNGISTEDIKSIWEEIESESHSSKQDESKTHKTKEPSKNEEYSMEHALMIREFLLRLWFVILNDEPIIVAWKSINICKRWDEITIYNEFDVVWEHVSWVFNLIDTEDNTTKSVIEVDWEPTLVAKIGYEDIIIWWKEEIDAGIFFRNHEEGTPYTVQEISNFLKSLKHY